MSICFSLYKVLPNVDFLGSEYDLASKEILEKNNALFKSIESTSEEINNSIDDFYMEKFSDGLKHKYLDLTNWYSGPKSKKNRNKRELRRIYNTFNVKSLITARGWVYKYLTVDEILYRQGWFLKKRFFKKYHTIYMATTKEQMKNWFDKYLDVNRKDKKGIECYNAFMNSWEDGCIFYVGF